MRFSSEEEKKENPPSPEKGTKVRLRLRGISLLYYFTSSSQLDLAIGGELVLENSPPGWQECSVGGIK